MLCHAFLRENVYNNITTMMASNEKSGRERKRDLERERETRTKVMAKAIPKALEPYVIVFSDHL